MRCLVLDVENSVTHHEYTNRNGDIKKHIDMGPYGPKNYLVSVGFQWVGDEEGSYFCIKHNEQQPTLSARESIQFALDQCDVLIGHNLKHDLKWLHECGFTYDGPTHCTQIAEFVLLRGRKASLKLKSLAEKYKVSDKKIDLTEGYLADGVGFEAMPWDIVEEYGRGDVNTTTELYIAQRDTIDEDDNKGLWPTVRMMNAFMYAIIEMEKNGISVDFDELGKIKADYIKEHAQLQRELTEMAQAVIGDTPVRLTSNDFLSELLFSRKVTDKNKWKEVFGIRKDHRGKDLPRTRMKNKPFNVALQRNSTVTKRTVVEACPICDGAGTLPKFKKDGSPYKKFPKCTRCLGETVVYTPTHKVAGFKLKPTDVNDLAAHGFATNTDKLERLLHNAKDEARLFIEKYARYNAVSSYISTFVEGIERYTGGDGILHTSLNQTIASTGRLSSSGPNLHNQPRGNTFPVRRAFVSRFDGGKMLKADYGQLEFRGAGYLSGCTIVRGDIDNGVDVHSYTRDTINAYDNEPDITRQDAKSDTFKPLYGGMSGSPRQVNYYKSFLAKYSGVTAWHEKLKTEALTTKRVVLPSGREYAFPGAQRLQGGYVKGTTQIVNWPVQGFATGDLVPLGVLSVYRKMKARTDLKSVMMITVHDDLEIDVYPGEEEEVTKIITEGLLDLNAMCMEFYNLDFKYPLEVEVSIGPNLLDQDTIATEHN